MQDTIIYEQPLSESFRHFLQLEHYTSLINSGLENKLEQDLNMIQAFINILVILERNSIQKEVINDIKAKVAYLKNLQKHPDIDQEMLKNSLDELSQHSDAVYNVRVKIPKALKENELIMRLRKKMPLSGSACQVDLPGFQYWLNLENQHKKELVTQWLSELTPILDAVRHLLSLTRQSAIFESNKADAGFFQTSLNQKSCQLIRLQMPKSASLYPEISAGRHRISIRFFQAENLAAA